MRAARAGTALNAARNRAWRKRRFDNKFGFPRQPRQGLRCCITVPGQVDETVRLVGLNNGEAMIGATRLQTPPPQPRLPLSVAGASLGER